MAAMRPWWHEIVAGLSTERTPAPRSAGAAPRPTVLEGISTSRNAEYGAGASPKVRSSGGFIRRKVPEWDPGSPAEAWVRHATHDGRAIAIRRAQDARRPSQTMGITPAVSRGSYAPRASSEHKDVARLASPAQRAPWPSCGERARALLPATAACRPQEPHQAAHSRTFAAAAEPTHSSLLVRRRSHETSCYAPGTEAASAAVLAPALCPFPAVSAGHDRRSPAVDHQPATIVTSCARASAHRPALDAQPPGSGVQAPTKRRLGVSSAPPTGCDLPSRDESVRLPALQGKGAKHARLCGDPWVSALERLPPLPLAGTKRARAGLAEVPLTSDDLSRVKRERAACALASILPWASAGFVLGDSDAMVASRSVSETTDRLVRALSAYGVSSTEAAHSALGRLLSWVILHRPGAPTLEGSHVSDFLEHVKPSATTLTALTWLRDHCGIALPARGPVCRPHRCRPPIAPPL